MEGGEYMPLIDRMKEARTRKGLTQERIAKEIGVAKSTYTGYETGNSEPSMLILSRIMNILEVDANFLFQDEMAALHEANATPAEMEHLVKKYRSLDPYGKEAVDVVLDVERRRCEASGKSGRPMIQAAARSGDVSEIEETSPDEVIESGDLPR